MLVQALLFASAFGLLWSAGQDKQTSVAIRTSPTVVSSSVEKREPSFASEDHFSPSGPSWPRIEAIWHVPADAGVVDIGWLDNTHALAFVSQETGAQLLLLPENTPLYEWTHEKTVSPYFSIEPDLLVSDGKVYFVRQQRLYRAFPDLAQKRLTEVRVIADFRESAWKRPTTPKGWDLDPSVKIHWGIADGKVLALPRNRYGGRVYGLECARNARVTAFSTDGRALFVRYPEKDAEVWHIEPERDRVVWRRKIEDLSYRFSDLDMAYADRISWDIRQQEATVIYTTGTAGAFSIAEIVGKSGCKIMHDPHSSEQIAEDLPFPHETVAFGKGMALAGWKRVLDFQLNGKEVTAEEYQLGFWNRRTNKSLFPPWGLNIEKFAVSPDRSKLLALWSGPQSGIEEMLIFHWE